MPTGTSMVVMTTPATTSCRSQDDSYRTRVVSPGSHCFQPARFASTGPRCARWKDSGSLIILATSRSDDQEFSNGAEDVSHSDTVSAFPDRMLLLSKISRRPTGADVIRIQEHLLPELFLRACPHLR